MHGTLGSERTPAAGAGFSVVMAERVLELADQLGLPADWEALWIGNPSGRQTAYPAAQRWQAVLAGLACGLNGVAPGNQRLRPCSALQERLGGRFPDQGTIHRWLQQTTSEEAAAVRAHLHQLIRTHGRTPRQRFCGGELLVDVDGQSIVARGKRFERAALGYCDGRFKPCYQRFCCYVPSTREVIDEVLCPGNVSAMAVFPEMLAGLNEVFDRQQRATVVLRGDAHFGTISNLIATQAAGYRYVFKLLTAAVKRLRRCWADRPPTHTFVHPQTQRPVACWDIPEWTITRNGPPKQTVCSRVVLFREQEEDGPRFWALACHTALAGQDLWQCYRDRGGAIEEFNDQSEAGFHLEVKRTGRFDGLATVHLLAAVCWNLITWATFDLYLPPSLAPHADRHRWIAAQHLSLPQLQQRASYSGVVLHRNPGVRLLEVTCFPDTTESQLWLRWLRQPHQRRLALAG